MVAATGVGIATEGGAGQPRLEQAAFPEPPDEEYWGEICGEAPGREERLQRVSGRSTGDRGVEDGDDEGGARAELGQEVGVDQGAAGGGPVRTQEERRGKRRNEYSIGGVAIGETLPRGAYTVFTLGSNKRSKFRFSSPCRCFH